MTVIVSTIWDGRVNMVVDRRISRPMRNHSVVVVDDESNKLVVVQCHGALFAIAYTGVAVTHQAWMDCVIADCLAHRKLSSALAQHGSSLLARPTHALIEELKINLNGALNTDKLSRLEHLELLVQGWEYGKERLIPFSCKLTRGPRQVNGNRYFGLSHHAVAKFFREHPSGIWGKSLGDDGGAIDKALHALKSAIGFTHDDVERHLRQAVVDRSLETDTVSPSCVAVQIDPRVADGQVLFTYYPHETSGEGYPRCTARIGAEGTYRFVATSPSRLLTVPPVVVLDACVLYPAAQRDLFMWLAAGSAIHAHWTNEIHDE